MFCSNCGSKIDDDSAFCTSCGHHVQKKKNVSIDINQVKSFVSVGLSLLKKPSSYVQVLQSSMNPQKNLIFLIGLLVLMPVIPLGFSALNLLLFSRISLEYLFKFIPISTILTTVIFSVAFNILIFVLCYYITKFFTKVAFKYDTDMNFDDLVRVSTLPSIYSFISTILALLLFKISASLSAILIILTCILFIITLFSGYKSLLSDFELLPVAFSLGFFISLALSSLIAFELIGNTLISSFRYF